MSNINRRQWIQKNVLAASLLAMGCRVPHSIESIPVKAETNSSILPLHWNENPYGPSKKAVEAVTEAMQKANRYPDDMVSELKEILASKFSLNAENFFLTAGSTEILGLMGQQIGRIKGEILIPWPSFPTILFFGESSGATVKKVPLDTNDCIDLDSILAAITDKTSLVFICNPNNPTSTEVDNAALKAFCRKVPKHVLVFIDEAYIEYSKLGENGSMVSLVKEVPNLIISRTFSKAYGLAGLRLGYAISNKKNIDTLRSWHTGAEISTGWSPLVAAKATLADTNFIATCVQKNEEGRKIVYQAFDKWGVTYNPSSTNFIYAQSKLFVKDVVPKLKEQNILITKWPSMVNHIRISISEPEHMRQFVQTVEQFLI